MANLYLGQQVKVVRDLDNCGQPPIGSVGFINEPYGFHMGWLPGNKPSPIHGYGVFITDSPSPLPMDDYGPFREYYCRPEELEPILPEGLESPERIKELYEPTPETVT